MKKKNIIIIAVSAVVAVALIVGLVLVLRNVFKSKPSGSGNAQTGDFAITADSASASAGGTVRIPVKISGNPGTMGYLLEFDYDETVLTYTSFDNGEVIPDCELSDTDGVIKLVGIAEKDITDNGVLVYLNFKVADGAKAGDTEIKLITDENSVCNYDEESIVPAVTNGKVTIK